jgi:predicted nucleic acid-binding protein
MTICYFDATALVSLLTPGPSGDLCAAVWKAIDAPCSHDHVEIEVPSLIGTQLNRVAWIWTLNSLALTRYTEDIRKAAIDLAWLGAPPNIAIHVATAQSVGADHFVTSDSTTESWAMIQGLNVIAI